MEEGVAKPGELQVMVAVTVSPAEKLIPVYLKVLMLEKAPAGMEMKLVAIVVFPFLVTVKVKLLAWKSLEEKLNILTVTP